MYLKSLHTSIFPPLSILSPCECHHRLSDIFMLLQQDLILPCYSGWYKSMKRNCVKSREAEENTLRRAWKSQCLNTIAELDGLLQALSKANCKLQSQI